MKTKRRGRKGEVHLFKPAGATSWWIRYTADGKRHRANTGKENEAEARIFAANVGRMVDLANSDNLDEKRRLLDICRELLREMPELQAEAALVGNMEPPATRTYFSRELDAMRQNTSGDDRAVKATSVDRVRHVIDDFVAFLAARPVNLADAPINRVGSDDVRAFLAHYKAKGYSGSSRKFALARIRAVFGHAVDAGVLTVNPATAKRVAKGGRLKFDAESIRQAFNPCQIAAVLKAAKESSEPWLLRSALLGLFTGQRVGDIMRMKWEDVRDFNGLLPTIHLVQQKTGGALVIPIAEPLRRELATVPRSERVGYLLGDKIAIAYAGSYRNLFHRPWRALLNHLDLAGMVEVPTLAIVEGNGTHGRTRFAWCFHSWRHTTATYLSGPDAHYLLGHRTADEKRLGTTTAYRHSDLQRLKKQLDVIPTAPPENVTEINRAAEA